MAAAAYKVTLVLRNRSGQTKSLSYTASDVAAASWLNAAGQGVTTLNGTEPVQIIDAILSAAGTDTTQSEFYIGGVSTGFFLQNATSLATTINRPFNLAPMTVPAGQTLQVVQRA